jgi:hypothetical protein
MGRSLLGRQEGHVTTGGRVVLLPASKLHSTTGILSSPERVDDRSGQCYGQAFVGTCLQPPTGWAHNACQSAVFQKAVRLLNDIARTSTDRSARSRLPSRASRSNDAGQNCRTGCTSCRIRTVRLVGKNRDLLSPSNQQSLPGQSMHTMGFAKVLRMQIDRGYL